MILLPHRQIHADTDRFPLVTLREILTTAYPSDAHYALYEPRDGTISDLPRLRSHDSESVLLRALSLDYDNPDHKPHEDPSWAVKKLTLFFEDNPDLIPAYWHLTRAGARFIYELPRPLTAPQFETLHQQVVETFARRGLQLDTGCWQWNRLFRAPKVVRDGVTRDPQVFMSNRTLDLTPYDLSAAPRSYAFRPHQGALPNLAQARQRVFFEGKLTKWGKKAEARLQGRDLLPECFELHPEPWPDPRNVSIMKAAGSACSLLHGQLKTTPEHLFGLMLERTQQSERGDGRNLVQELWKMICYCWGREAGKLKHEQETHQANQQTLRTQTEDPAVLNRLIVRTKRGTYYVLNPTTGFYDRLSVDRYTGIRAMRQIGLEAVVPLTKTTTHGTRDLTWDEVLSRHLTVVEPEIKKRPGRSWEQGWLEGRTLVFGSYCRRSDLTPTYSSEVDEWLRILLPADRFEDVCRWIGKALDFEGGPICALSVASPPGVGKGLLVAGLTEATDPPTPPATNKAFGDYQYRLEDTPWVHVDETWGKVSDVGQTLKNLIGQGVVDTQVKYGHMRPLEASPRILLTANNESMVERLFAGSMSHEDVQAVAKRLFHIRLNGDAATYLEKKGSYAYTKGWVESSYGPSEHILAKHFLWLYEKHKDTPPMGRFLVEDMTDAKKIAWLTIKANQDVARVAHAVVQMLRRTQFTTTADGGVWISLGDLYNEISFSHKYTIPQISTHLKILTTAKDPESRKRKLDMEKIGWVANEAGVDLSDLKVAA